MPADQFSLWGYHPAYTGEDGYPYPLLLATGNRRQINGEKNRRKKEDQARRTASARGDDTVPGEWTLAVYAENVPPAGLRARCDKDYPERSRAGEGPCCGLCMTYDDTTYEYTGCRYKNCRCH